MIEFKEEGVRETQWSFIPICSTKTYVNMVYTVEFPEEENLKQHEALAKSGTPIFLLEARPDKDKVIQVQ